MHLTTLPVANRFKKKAKYMLIKSFSKYSRVENSIEYPNAVFIQQNSPPFFWGQVWKFKQAEEMERYLKTKPPAAHAQIPGYNILITYVGNLDQQRVTTTLELLYLQTCLTEMAVFYHNERIIPNGSYYKKFAEQKATGPAGPR